MDSDYPGWASKKGSVSSHDTSHALHGSVCSERSYEARMSQNCRPAAVQRATSGSSALDTSTANVQMASAIPKPSPASGEGAKTLKPPRLDTAHHPTSPSSAAANGALSPATTHLSPTLEAFLTATNPNEVLAIGRSEPSPEKAWKRRVRAVEDAVRRALEKLGRGGNRH